MKYNKKKKEIIVFTDGSTLNNRRGALNAAGGCGVYFGESNKNNISQPFFLLDPTNQRCELYAIILALNNIIKNIRSKKKCLYIKIYTDSKYSIDCITKWSKKWKINNWKKKNGENVLNKDLIYWIDKIITFYKNQINVEFIFVKAHKEKPKGRGKEYKIWLGNYKADILSRKASELFYNKLVKN